MKLLNKNFSEISPLCYKIAEKKGVYKRHIINALDRSKQAHTIRKEKLPVIISSHSSNLIKKGPGIDPELQYNKAHNIDLACSTFNGMIIRPGEEFSFWRTVGNTTRKKGYKDGRVIEGDQLKPNVGGGLCNLGNTLHLLVLHSPLKITEIHHHSDALAPDHGPRVPFSSGTSVSYNYIDFRFKNNTHQLIQLCAWVEDEQLHAELRTTKEFPWTYEITEENHHFSKEGDKYFRISRIYRETKRRSTGEVIDKQLIRDNHSEVMYDYDLIPKELIK